MSRPDADRSDTPPGDSASPAGNGLPDATGHLDTDVLHAAALALGLHVRVLDTTESCLCIEHKAQRLLAVGNHTNLTDSALRLFVNSKHLANQVLGEQGFPVPAAAFFSVDELTAIEKYIDTRPVATVLKPNAGSLNRGVSLKPRGRAEVRNAVAAAKRFGYRGIIVEDFIYGRGFRALVFRGEILDVLESRPPAVWGDGEQSIAGLVESANRLRTGQRLKPLLIDTDWLAVHGFRPHEVLPRGMRCQINPSSAFAVGGGMARVPLAAVAPENLDLFRRIADSNHLQLCGIDFISRDIGQPYTRNGAMVNELNSCPNIYIHYFANPGPSLQVPCTLLRRYFGLSQG